MKTWTGRAVATAMAGVMALAPVTARADDDDDREDSRSNPLRNVAVTGTTEDGRRFTGRLDVERFQLIGDQIIAVGSLSGRVAGGGRENRPISKQAVALPVQVSQGAPGAAPQGGFGGETGALGPSSTVRPAALQVGAAGAPWAVPAQQVCPILHLTLGPLDLNLLGLVVHLDQVVLNIDAQAGPGNLLGNLLCAVAGLLDPPNLAGLLALLNQIVNLLNGLL